eukprot:TRINITY_DN2505_c0_g1_i1.p1 TRINITY_DN2505_c0_g1~~TRINITY_DN2505_c0_g1_i1.p1  ORF type:complete len:370 (-),score=37.68 TRINITY_DN2505_c0_g1_i1:1098-2207(-)
MSHMQKQSTSGPPPSYSSWGMLPPPKFMIPPHSRSEATTMRHVMNSNPNTANLVFNSGNNSNNAMLRGGTTFLAPKKPRHAWKSNHRRVSNTNERNQSETQATLCGSGYEPPRLQDLQFQNRLKSRQFFKKRKKKFYKPFAPRNTTSFIMRAKKEGGIPSLVSPCPVTPSILPTPVISPVSEGLTDMAKEEWGVDGYGSMNGFIRLKDKDRDAEAEDDSASSGGSDSDVEEVERRLDHDLSRFEMIYPSSNVDPSSAWGSFDQEAQLARLEEENLTLKERLFLMQREMDDLRRRLEFLECRNPNHSPNPNVFPKLERDFTNSNSNDSENDDAACSEKSIADCDVAADDDAVKDKEDSSERSAEASGPSN